ncbi:type II secretory system protein [Candidatus Scalindua japonica]|uniref:Type II secretory system protein n=1 Tax=Candidatus Scalindua japonica TaxID=1284222 RepID=A0A286TYB0_9BACT|nr:ATPase, T2SS/T4P/T4SS family [Candidatus Scalindua japonica]GAX60872.1 type II secretory system protein [Candidatus Scalindua japonica]
MQLNNFVIYENDMKTSFLSLGQLLKEKGIISDDQLSRALAHQKRQSIRLGEALAEMGYADNEDIISSLAEQFDFQVINPVDIQIPEDVINIIPKNIAKKHNIIPVTKHDRLLIIAISDPLDISTLEDLRFTLNINVECVLATKNNIQDAIKKYYDKERYVSFDGYLDGFKSIIASTDKSLNYSFGVEEEAEAPVVKLVTYIIDEAVKARASDIHIEPFPNKTRIRYRIDGVCQDVHSITRCIHDALISRIKILARIDITEKRKPQDGRISSEVDEKSVDIRVSTIPTTCGESIVMRILEKSTVLIQLKSMGFSDKDFYNFKSVLKKPNGIFLITGPTGSGKSTTLYASLNEIDRSENKIITVEDPIEYNLSGINQCQVNEMIGLTFPSMLRSVLRQDPNIIVIGEIRDVETAEIAVTSALTGHLVMSTLHTNDAPSAITRLVDMGIKPFLISSSIQAILAQRLVRVICPKCKVPHKIEKDVLEAINIDNNDLANSEFYHGTGCEYCNRTGYRGRKPIFEFMSINTEIRDAIFNNLGTNELRKIVQSNGMTTLAEDGLRLARAQITTLEEVIRITTLDSM